MATSKINFTVTDGNLFTTVASADYVSSLVFDVTTSPSDGTAISADGEVHQIFSVKQAEELGITGLEAPYETPTGDEYEGGVVHKHISDFFAVNQNGELYVGLADMSTDFTHISRVQTVAQGRIRQQGIYTPQELFVAGTPYTVDHVSAIQSIADGDADNNKPYSVILHASVATFSSGAENVEIEDIPTAIGTSNRVSVTMGQANDEITNALQDNNTTKATVGCVGALMGALSLANIQDSIGWTAKFDIASVITTIAFGFGGVVTDISDNTPIDSLSPLQLDTLDGYGYIFPLTYTDYAGTFASSNQTLSAGDYRTIVRNRSIDKSSRNVRVALLPTIQQPLYVNATTGELSIGTINQFKSIVHTQLIAMQAAGEISGFAITINPNQNVLANDGVNISYRIIPVGENKQINVEIGLATSIS